MFVFHHPQDLAKKMKAGETVETPTFDTAQEEIAKSSGLMGSSDGKSKGIPFIVSLRSEKSYLFQDNT